MLDIVVFEAPEALRTAKRKLFRRDYIELPLPHYKKGTELATRKAFGETLALMGEYRTAVVSLHAEVKKFHLC